MINIAICTTRPEDALTLQKALQHKLDTLYADAQLHLYNKGMDLLCAQQRFSFVFIDTQLPDASGLQIAHALRLREESCEIIFLSHSSEAALSCYSVHPADYMLYPINIQRLVATLERHKNTFLPAMRFIETTFARLTQRTFLSNITFIEVLGRSCLIHQSSGPVSTTNCSLGNLCAQLQSDTFIRVHRSYVVNLYQIRSLGAGFLLMTDDQSVPFTRENLEVLQKKLSALPSPTN